MAEIGTLYRPCLDDHCLICLNPLPAVEIDYWKKRLENKTEWDKEPRSLMRVSCVKCATKRGTYIPKELRSG